MAQTLLRFDTPVVLRNGRQYRAQACGRARDNGQWEAWLEFEDITTGETMRTQRETTQPNYTDAAYWATGLTPVYLEGALDRILRAEKRVETEFAPPPFFDAPAPRESTVSSNREPILDPFSVYEKSPDLLAQQLTALRGWHLRRIIRDFDLVEDSNTQLDTLNEPQLGALIMRRVSELRR